VMVNETTGKVEGVSTLINLYCKRISIHCFLPLERLGFVGSFG
jgi:hypothetical protein